MIDEQPATPFNPIIVRPDGRPTRLARDARCPQCGADADQRVLSSGFGAPHEICQRCGFERFEE